MIEKDTRSFVYSGEWLFVRDQVEDGRDEDQNEDEKHFRIRTQKNFEKEFSADNKTCLELDVYELSYLSLRVRFLKM